MRNQPQSEQFERIKGQIQCYLERKPYQLTEQRLREMGSTFLANINDKFSSQNELLKEIVTKNSAVLNQFIQINQQYELKIMYVNEQMEEKNAAVQSLADTNINLEKEIKEYQVQLQKMKLEIVNLTEKFEYQQKLFKRERKQIKKTFREAQEINEADRSLFEEIYNQKEILLTELKNYQKINQQLKEEEKQLGNKLSENDKQLKIMQNKFDFQVKSKISLEQSLKDYKQIICKLTGQLQSMKERMHSSFAYGKAKVLIDAIDENQYLQQQQVKHSFIKAVSLSDEIPYISKDDFNGIQYQQRRISDIRRSYEYLDQLNQTFDDKQNLNDQNQNIELGKKFKNISIDPYFAHFILTSQAVKIKQDCEDLLNIDIKPYYKQIVQKRIPMHLWDQWIRNRLKQLFKKMKSHKDEDW